MIGFTVFVYFQVPETKGKTIEEIAGKFSPSGDKIEVRPRSMKMCILSICYGQMQKLLVRKSLFKFNDQCQGHTPQCPVQCELHDYLLKSARVLR